MKRIVVHVKMLKLEIATACFVVKLKNAIISDMAIPPPPMPATVHSAITKANEKTPIVSTKPVGKTSLWPQIPGSSAPQTKKR